MHSHSISYQVVIPGGRGQRRVGGSGQRHVGGRCHEHGRCLVIHTGQSSVLDEPRWKAAGDNTMEMDVPPFNGYF